MEIKYRLYPYPVLWNKNDDYKKPSKFSVEIEAKENFKNIKLKINFLLKDKEIENLINKGILEANSYIQQEEEKEKQKNFYSKYISLVNKIYEEEKIDTFGEICELIKINKNQT